MRRRFKLVSLVLTIAIILSLVVSFSGNRSADASGGLAKDFALGATAKVSDNPPTITISWPAPKSSVTTYNVFRKGLNDTSWGNRYMTVPGSQNSFSDTNIEVGKGYEYYITDANPGNILTGYIYSGIKLPETEYRGKVILLFDSSYTTYISTEVDRLVSDMKGDGWQVIRHDVDRTLTPPQIKALIKTDYDADPTNVKTVFLLGHIAIPKSGYAAPDGHELRPLPADSYYGDMTGTWTDTIDYTSSIQPAPAKPNVPGDGVFDQNNISNPIQLEVGRVDAYNMTSRIKKNEANLLKIYLDKDHNYRMKLLTTPHTAFIDDPWQDGPGTEATGANIWRNCAPLLDDGFNSITPGDWTTGLSGNAYEWGGMIGPGNYTEIQNNKINYSMFMNGVYKVNFIMGFGSYFFEWDTINNLLRAPLFMKDYGLETMWTGRPNWFIHPMGMGATFGSGMKTTINNGVTYLYNPPGYSPGGVYVALMGDPTLHLYIIDPPTNLQTSRSGKNATLSWDASKDSVIGYYVYRANDMDSPFTRITDQPVTGTSFTDTDAPNGSAVYMVRAIRLETTGSGSYYNLSQGAFANLDVSRVLFPDVNASSFSWAQDAVETLAGLNIINGIDVNGQIMYKPADTVTRAQLAKLLVAAYGFTQGGQPVQFSDTSTHWAKEYIEIASSQGIVNGYTDNTFRPEANIKREELAVMISRAMSKKGVGTPVADNEVDQKLSVFLDQASIDTWARKDVAFAVSNSIIQGSPAEGGGFNFLPQNSANRAETAVMLKRCL